MLPGYLLPEQIASEDGQGAHVVLDQALDQAPDQAGVPFRAQHVQLTLGITRILERESLAVEVCGSADGLHWRRLAAFPRKSFCGTYSLTLDLSPHQEVKYLRTEWKMHRWSHEEAKPVFAFYVWAEHLHQKALQAAS
jgi:hypothetical protein